MSGKYLGVVSCVLKYLDVVSCVLPMIREMGDEWKVYRCSQLCATLTREMGDEWKVYRCSQLCATMTRELFLLFLLSQVLFRILVSKVWIIN